MDELKEIKSNFCDWDRHHGFNLDSDQIKWLIETVEKQGKKIEGLEIVISAERGFVNGG